MDLPVEDEAELAQCPWCTKPRRCAHEVLWASKEAGGWRGLLADATEKLSNQLGDAIAAVAAAGRPVPRKVSVALEELADTFVEIDDEIRWSPSAFNDYWIALADAVEGSVIREIEWQDGLGRGDLYTHGYFQDAEDGIATVLRRARRDLELLWAVVPPPELTPFALLDVVDRWREARHDDDAALIIQALSLWSAQVERVLTTVRCSACHGAVPSVFSMPHALCCDAGPAVRRWRLAANEVAALAESLPAGEKKKVPPTFESLGGYSSPRHVELITRSLPAAVRESTEQLIAVLLSKATPEQLSSPVITPPDRLGGVDFGPGARLFAIVEARELMDQSAGDCPWCKRVLATAPAALDHQLRCAKHPLLEQALTLEDWCAGFRDHQRHPVVAALQGLHERRTAVRHLLAASITLEQGDGELDRACTSFSALAQSRPPEPNQPMESVLGDSQRATLRMHELLVRLLVSCRALLGRLEDVALRTRWNEARAHAESELACSDGQRWKNESAPEELPHAFQLAHPHGRLFWRTGQPVVRGAELLAAMKAADEKVGLQRNP